MFDFAWTEIALIGVVALVAIGPKDLPIAIKTVAGFVKKARRMAAEFQTHVDELVREADLHEVRNQINQIRNFDIRGEIEKAVDADGSIRTTLSTNPLSTNTLSTNPLVTPPPVTAPDGSVEAPSARATERGATELGATERGATELGAAQLGAAQRGAGGVHAGVAEAERSEPAGQSRNVSETRVLERPADTVVAAEPARFPEPPAFIPPAFIPPGTSR